MADLSVGARQQLQKKKGLRRNPIESRAISDFSGQKSELE